MEAEFRISSLRFAYPRIRIKVPDAGLYRLLASVMATGDCRWSSLLYHGRYHVRRSDSFGNDLEIGAIHGVYLGSSLLAEEAPGAANRRGPLRTMRSPDQDRTRTAPGARITSEGYLPHKT